MVEHSNDPDTNDPDAKTSFVPTVLLLLLIMGMLVYGAPYIEHGLFPDILRYLRRQ